jgi:hypothetical protein
MTYQILEKYNSNSARLQVQYLGLDFKITYNHQGEINHSLVLNFIRSKVTNIISKENERYIIHLGIPHETNPKGFGQKHISLDFKNVASMPIYTKIKDMFKNKGQIMGARSICHTYPNAIIPITLEILEDLYVFEIRKLALKQTMDKTFKFSTTRSSGSF